MSTVTTTVDDQFVCVDLHPQIPEPLYISEQTDSRRFIGATKAYWRGTQSGASIYLESEEGAATLFHDQIEKILESLEHLSATIESTLPPATLEENEEQFLGGIFVVDYKREPILSIQIDISRAQEWKPQSIPEPLLEDDE